ARRGGATGGGPATRVSLPPRVILRISPAPVSAMYGAGPGPIATSAGLTRRALSAGVPLPTHHGPGRPVPAMVVMIPDGDTARIRLFPVSAKYSVPDRATVMPPGSFKTALAAGPPSPEKPALPVPAITANLPPGRTWRISLRPSSAR